MTRIISIILFITTMFGCMAQSQTSRKDSLVKTAKEVSMWFGPDFNVADAETDVKGPLKFTTADGRPEVQENDGRDYFEVIFRSGKSSDGSTYLSKVFLWNDGEPFEVLFSNGFGRDFFVDTYADLKSQDIAVLYPFTDLYFHLPVEVASDLFQKVKPDDVGCIMHARQKALTILDALPDNVCGIQDRNVVKALLTAKPASIDTDNLSRFPRVRSIQVMDGIFIYPYFSCHFRKEDSQWYFHKTTGSQRKSGYLYENSPESMVFLGGWTVNNDPLTTYNCDNGVAGTLYQLSDNHLIMLFIDPERDNTFEIYEFRK
ncbi:MAG: DUF4893 domain-containing protein [Prevotellaceae bacterium]|nr:DUF4893 domain-containing protein [Prevotellaceae bacterium]